MILHLGCIPESLTAELPLVQVTITQQTSNWTNDDQDLWYHKVSFYYTESWINFNPLRAKIFRGNINIYLHFVSFLHIDTTEVVEIYPQIRQEPTYST